MSWTGEAQVEARIPSNKLETRVKSSAKAASPRCLLFDITHLTLLRKNFLPIHVAAFP